MDWTRLLSVRRAVALFVSPAAAGTLVNGGLSLKLESDSERIAQRLIEDVRLTRASGTVDMMHDPLRGDVQQARSP